MANTVGKSQSSCIRSLVHGGSEARRVFRLKLFTEIISVWPSAHQKSAKPRATYQQGAPARR